MLSDLAESLGRVLTSLREAVGGLGVHVGEVQPMVLVLAVVCLLLMMLTAVAMVRARRARRRVQIAQAVFAEKFQRPGLRLEDVPEQFAELDRKIAGLMRDFEQLRQSKSERPAPPRVRPPFIELLAQLSTDASAEISRNVGDAQFARIDGVLRVRTMLAELDAHLARLAGVTDLPESLRGDLRSTDAWHAVLTTPCVFDVYFGASEAFAPLSRRLRAIEQVVRSAFLRADVDILVQRPLAKVEQIDIPTPIKEAPRDLSSLPAVRERAMREARASPDRSAIVLDCFAPGWNSARIGSKPAQFTIYDPAG
jgi:hypothetical protein